MRRIAIVVTRGTTNNVFQVATLVRAATALEVTVDVFFEREAALKLARERINRPEWAAVYAPVLAALEERLRAADFVDLESFLRDAKEHGDHVTFLASRETLAAAGLSRDALTPLVDATETRSQFDTRAQDADVRLDF